MAAGDGVGGNEAPQLPHCTILRGLGADNAVLMSGIVNAVEQQGIGSILVLSIL